MSADGISNTQGVRVNVTQVRQIRPPAGPIRGLRHGIGERQFLCVSGRMLNWETGAALNSYDGCVSPAARQMSSAESGEAVLEGGWRSTRARRLASVSHNSLLLEARRSTGRPVASIG
ncbi:MAG: hypothetical protein JWN40_3965 [Phycisphaerales bacterium]|nr:hypothetical protein [Phycisphaerales bacterium]